MNNNSENQGGSSPRVVNEFSLVVTAIKIVVLAIFLVPFVKYTLVSKQVNETNSTVLFESKSISEENVTIHNNVTQDEEIHVNVVKKVIIPQPACPKSQIVQVLNEICTDVVFKYYFCSPADKYNPKKHKIPKFHVKNKSSKDPKVPAIINYLVGGLLISSLGAALLEYYKAKMQPTKKDGKAPLSRKCSLADLTVMKHHRKELIRRDSIMEVPEERHKAFGIRPPPLHRRCSFPVAQNATPANPYGIPINNTFQHISILDTRKSSIAESRLVITDGRRISIDRKVGLLDGRRISISEQNSPERKHHGRLVNRH